jgi:hypothetical protein
VICYQANCPQKISLFCCLSESAPIRLQILARDARRVVGLRLPRNLRNKDTFPRSNLSLKRAAQLEKCCKVGGNRQAGLPRTLRVHLSARFLFGASEGGDSDVWLGIVPCGGRRTSFSVRREATSPAEWSNVCCSCGTFAACNRLFSCSRTRVMAALREDMSCVLIGSAKSGRKSLQCWHRYLVIGVR